jgi:hypothetical protein
VYNHYRYLVEPFNFSYKVSPYSSKDGNFSQGTVGQMLHLDEAKGELIEKWLNENTHRSIFMVNLYSFLKTIYNNTETEIEK